MLHHLGTNITLAIKNYKSFATFLNNIYALNLAGAIDRSVGKGDGLLSAHATVSVNRSDLKQSWPNKMYCSYKQNTLKWYQSAVKHSSMNTGKSLATFSDIHF